MTFNMGIVKGIMPFTNGGLGEAKPPPKKQKQKLKIIYP